MHVNVALFFRKASRVFVLSAIFWHFGSFALAQSTDGDEGGSKSARSGRHLYLVVSHEVTKIIECDIAKDCSAEGQKDGVVYYSIPLFLKNFEFNFADFRKSPVLDRAIIAANRLASLKDQSIEKRQFELDKISQDLALSSEDIRFAGFLLKQNALSAGQVRELSAGLRFQARDLLRLNDLLALESANSIYRDDANVFSLQEWQYIYAALHGRADINGRAQGLHRVDLLTVPAPFRSHQIRMTEVSNYLDRDQQYFNVRFKEVQGLRSKLNPAEQEEFVEMTCNSIRTYFLKDAAYPSFDPFMRPDSIELVSFFIDHSTESQRSAFVVDFVRKMITFDTHNSAQPKLKLARAVIAPNLALIKANPGLSAELFHIVVEGQKYDPLVEFDFVDELFEVWQEQGLFNSAKLHKAILGRFEEILKAWDRNFTNYEWFVIDWAPRIDQYKKLLPLESQDGVLSRVLTGKLGLADRHPTIRQANQKTLIALLEWVAPSSLSSGQLKSRLIIIAKAWAVSLPRSEDSYPEFEHRLTDLIAKTFAGDSLGSDVLIRALQTSAIFKQTSIAGFVQKIKGTLAQSDRGGSDFNSFYANEIVRALDGVFNTASDGHGGYLPLDPIKEREALSLYRDFRVRGTSRMRYQLSSEQVRAAKNRKLDHGPLFEAFAADLKKFGKYPALNDVRPPHLSLLNCADLLKPSS